MGARKRHCLVVGVVDGDKTFWLSKQFSSKLSDRKLALQAEIRLNRAHLGEFESECFEIGNLIYSHQSLAIDRSF